MKKEEKEKEIEKEIEDRAEEFGKDVEKEVEKHSGAIGNVIGAIIAVVINIGILVFINFYYDLVPIFTSDIEKWLPYANASIIISMAGQIALVFLKADFLRNFIQVMTNVASLVSVVALLRIYPYNLDEKFIIMWPETLFKFLHYAVILAISIAVIVNSIKAATSLIKGQGKSCK